jgi:hypothetical protein
MTMRGKLKGLFLFIVALSWRLTRSRCRIYLQTLYTSEVEVTLRLAVGRSVSQSVCLGVEPTLGLVTRYYFLSEGWLLSKSCRLVSVGRPLWREVGPVIFHSQSVAMYQYLHQRFTFHVFCSSAMYTKLLSVSAWYSRLCSTSYH